MAETDSHQDIDFARIELLVLDVDGVLTDGRIMLTPDGDEIKSFNVRDGSGMKYWKRVGGKLAQIGSRLIDATAKKMTNDFFARFAEVVGGPAPEEIPVSAEEAAPAGAVRPLFWALGVVAIVLVLLAIFGLN